MKKILLIILSTLIMTMLIGCRDKVDNSAIKSEQKRMAEYTVRNYEDIKKIEFLNFSQNTSTRTWSADAVINDEIHVTYDINKILSDEDIGIIHHISESKGKQLQKKKENDISTSDIGHIEVIYYEVK